MRLVGKSGGHLVIVHEADAHNNVKTKKLVVDFRAFSFFYLLPGLLSKQKLSGDAKL